MVSKKDLKVYDWETIEQYFDYIWESKTNGQFLQVVKLIEDMSKRQKKDFVLYANGFFTDDNDKTYLITTTIDLI